jgi:flagellar M-ring protein FliF
VIGALWNGLGRGARIGLVVGVASIVTVTGLAGYWLMHPEYEVLFADLTPQDALAMTAELDRQKIPYALKEEAGGGTTIRVEQKNVYQTRLKLMGKDIPLHGAVGFELFNNSDFGMTEFAQKINYQRALQGELTRTILSLSEIRDARVLLALPEQGLFKQATSKPKASITLSLKHGRVLGPEQVAGIQRLVAAAVPGVATQDVTIVDQSGVALTRSIADGDANASSARLDLKKDTENYLTRKATEVLERALGAGQALASVDVTLDMDRVQSSTEDVVPAPGARGDAQTGVVVRQRLVRREMGAPLGNGRSPAEAGATSGGESSQREVEYAVGRRVEQVINQPGSITRIQIVAIVRAALDAQQVEQIRRMVAASVGASLERGDTVVVQTMAAIASPAATGADDAPLTAAGPLEARSRDVARGDKRSPLGLGGTAQGGLLVSAGLVGGVLLSLRLRRRVGARSSQPPEPATTLSDTERQVVLSQVQAWLHGSSSPRSRGDLS